VRLTDQAKTVIGNNEKKFEKVMKTIELRISVLLNMRDKKNERQVGNLLFFYPSWVNMSVSVT